MSDPIRVVHIVRPGAEELREHVVGLCSGLSAHRVEAVVVGPLERPFREALSRRDVRWVNIPLPETLHPREQYAAVTHLARFLQAAPPAVIHAHGFQAAYTALAARRRLSVAPPLVVAPHGVPNLHDRGRPEQVLRRFGYRRVLASGDAVVVASSSEREALTAIYPTVKAAVVTHGVDRRRPSSVFDAGAKRRRVGLRQDAAVVVVMASLDHGVPLDDFLHSAALLSREIDNVDFAILGTGDRLEELQSLAHDLQLSGNAVFLGERHDALDILSTGNVMAVVTDDAWSAAAALQALARGLRVVPNDVPGLRELFEGVGSIRPVPVADHEAFSRALAEQLDEMTIGEDELEVSTGMAWGLSELMASQDEFDLDRPGLDPRDRRRHVNAEVQALLDRYSIPRMVEETVALYEKVVQSGAGQRKPSLAP